MTKLLIYLFPALMDIVIGGILYICPTRLTEQGYNPIIVTIIASVWALAYMTTSHFLGKILTKSNASKLIMISCISVTLICGGFILFPGVVMMFVLMAILGVATALFFSPFQVFMKAVGGGHDSGVVKSTALYTFSWSAGMAAGPFISAYLWVATSWQMCYVLIGGCSILTAIGIYLLKHHAEEHPVKHSEVATPAEPTLNRYEKMPDLAYMGWIVAGVGTLVVMLTKQLLPDTGKSIGLQITQTGNILFLLSGTQAITGLLMIKSKYWMFRRLPSIIFGLCGIAAMLLFVLCDSANFLYLAAVLYGVYSGSFFFGLVFHSLIHPQKAGKYVSVNESLVGLCGIIGPALGGLLVKCFQTTNLPWNISATKLPYAVCVGLLACGVISQIIILTRKKEIKSIIENS